MIGLSYQYLNRIRLKIGAAIVYASESAKWVPEVGLSWLKCPLQGLKKWAIQAPWYHQNH